MPDTVQDARNAAGIRYGPLEGSLGFLLRLSQLHSFAAFYRRLGQFDIKPGEISVLMMIGENPGIRQGLLARTLMIKRAHMTKMIRVMEDAGLVTRTVPEDDRRSVELWLTEPGRAMLDRLTPSFLEHEAHTGGTLTRTEEETLKRLLRKYIDFDAAGKDAP